MAKIFKYIFRVIPIFIYGFFFNLFHSNKNKHSRVLLANKYGDLLRRLNRKIGVKVIVSGKENIPNEQSCLICPNHQSMLDATTLISTFNNEPMSFVGKKSLKKVPVIGKVITNLHSLFIDREDIRQELKVMKGVQESIIKDDVRWIIFPEGTRTKDTVNYTCNDFKPGAFKYPMQEKKKIVPCAIFGTHRVLDKLDKHKEYPVYVHFFEPITPEVYKDLSTKEVALMTQNMVQAKVNEFMELDKKTKRI